MTVPVRLGLSLKDYYQSFDGDHAFGFFDIGGRRSRPWAVFGCVRLLESARGS